MSARLLIGLCLFCVASAAGADVFRPAYLELREEGKDTYAVLWKVPASGTGRHLSAYVQLPAGTETLSEPRVTSVEAYRAKPAPE